MREIIKLQTNYPISSDKPVCHYPKLEHFVIQLADLSANPKDTDIIKIEKSEFGFEIFHVRPKLNFEITANCVVKVWTRHVDKDNDEQERVKIQVEFQEVHELEYLEGFFNTFKENIEKNIEEGVLGSFNFDQLKKDYLRFQELREKYGKKVTEETKFERSIEYGESLVQFSLVEDKENMRETKVTWAQLRQIIGEITQLDTNRVMEIVKVQGGLSVRHL